MTAEALPSKEQLIREIRQFCNIGYVVKTKSLKVLGGLIELEIVGGPARPERVMEWRERRETLRSILREIANNEVKAALGEAHGEATIELFRLDIPRPVARHLQEKLNVLQDDLLDGVRRKAFVEEERPVIFEVIAEALIQREQDTQAAKRPGDLDEEPDSAEEIGPEASAGEVERVPEPDEVDNEDEKATDAEPGGSSQPEFEEVASEAEQANEIPAEAEPFERESPEEPSLTPLAVAVPPPITSPPSRAPQRQRLSGTARTLILVVSLIAAAAVALLVIRNQSPDSGQPKPEVEQQAKTSPQPAVSPPSKDSANVPAVPPINFTAEVVNWCYCGDVDTLESQIKMKPRFANHSARRIDLRTGGSARLGLAIYANASSDRSWITPTDPRYRRYGKWLVVPPNAPGDLVSTRMFETHWTRVSLRPFGEYLDPDHYEGDLVFNVPPDMVLSDFNVRLAYRLHNGDLYFPRKGARLRWKGNEEGRFF